MLGDVEPVGEDAPLHLLVPLFDPADGAHVPVHQLKVLAVVGGLALGLHDAVAAVEVDEVLPALGRPVPLGEARVERRRLVVLHFLLHCLLAHVE